MGSAWLTSDGAARVCNGGLLISESPCAPVCGGGEVSCCGNYYWPDPNTPCQFPGTSGLAIRCAPPTSTIIANLPSVFSTGSCGIITKPYYHLRVKTTGSASRFYVEFGGSMNVTLDGNWHDVLYRCPLPGNISQPDTLAIDPQDQCGTYSFTGTSQYASSGPVYCDLRTLFRNTTGPNLAVWDFGISFVNRSIGQIQTFPRYGTGLNLAYSPVPGSQFFNITFGSFNSSNLGSDIPTSNYTLTNTACPGMHSLSANMSYLSVDWQIEIETPFGDNCSALGYSPSSRSIPANIQTALRSPDPAVAAAAAAQIRAMGISCCGG